MIMKEKKKIIVLSGGHSEEAEVSKITASEIAIALDKQKFDVQIVDPVEFASYSEFIKEIQKFDPYIVINGLHGAEGEDGRLQALLELHHIPFTGSDFRSSAIAMDKYLSGIIASHFHILVPKRLLLLSNNVKKLPKQFDFPLVVKPNDSGSSVGISIVKDMNELNTSIQSTAKSNKKILIEEFIAGRELTVTILGNEALPIVEIKPKNGWYDYSNKYTKGNTIYEVPAKLTSKQTEQLQTQALLIFKELGCSIYGRVDFRFNDKNFYFLEVNTLPGMTPLSLTPMAAKKRGLNFANLIEKIIELSQEKFLKEL